MEGSKTVYVENSLGKFSFELKKYNANNKPAIVCNQLDEEMGGYVPYGNVSTNLDWEVHSDHIALNVHNLPDDFKNMLFEEKVLLGDINKPLVSFVQGFVTFPVYEYNKEKFFPKDGIKVSHEK